MCENPRRIFGLPEQPDTYIEVDMEQEWELPEAPEHSKAGWSPFAGMAVQGKLRKVVLRGEVALVDGKVLVKPGFGEDVRTWARPGPPERVRTESGRVEFGDRARAYSGALSPHPRALEDRPQLPLGDGLLVPAGLPLTPSHHSLAGCHILTAAMFDKEQLNTLFNLSDTLRTCVMKERRIDHILKGKVMVLLGKGCNAQFDLMAGDGQCVL